MKRNMDLVRKICFAVEKLECETTATELKIQGFETPEIVYHCQIMIEAGLLLGAESALLSHEDYEIFRLTWAGHEFVDAVRNDNVWAKVIGNAQRTVDTISFETLKSYVAQFVISHGLPSFT